MTESADFDWDALIAHEGDFMLKVVENLSGVQWAEPALAKLARAGGVRRENKDLLFELRFADALAREGLEARYEIEGEGSSTIDFGVRRDGQLWRIELLRLNETKAVKEATLSEKDADDVTWSRRFLSTGADDKRQSTEGETLKAIERICQKCESAGQPHKFPAPDGSLNVILVDCRTVLHGGDTADRLHIALGADFVPPEFRLLWEGKPITGVFHPETTLRGAKEARERVHFIGFVNEKEFAAGTMAAAIQLVANPGLFETEAEVRTAITSWPLPPAMVINLSKT